MVCLEVALMVKQMAEMKVILSVGLKVDTKATKLAVYWVAKMVLLLEL